MLVVSFTSCTGVVRSFEAVDRVRLVGNTVQLGSYCHSIASYAAGLWFYENGQETFDRLDIHNCLEIHFEVPAEQRTGGFRQAEHIEVIDAEIRIGTDEMIARLDDRLQNWYLSGSHQAWPVVVLQSLN